LSFVIDASLALCWYFPDETSAFADSVLFQTSAETTFVPHHWKVEVANGLTMGVRRNRISSSYREQTLAVVDALEYQVDTAGIKTVWPDAVAIADRRGLTVYDALYVELAKRTNSKLATLDKAMKRAAVAEGISIVEAQP
jgi:predicted nucleic acid-binding protein